MARNEEKAQSMLNRFLAGKKEEQGQPKQRRPYLASECLDLVEADKWRQQILREIGKKVMEIQNAGLGEHRCASSPPAQLLRFCQVLSPHYCCNTDPCFRAMKPRLKTGSEGSWCLTQHVCNRIRDLNDEINKLIREKGHWEARIVELGGPNYSKVARITDQEGNELGGATGRGAGYKYFGAAKQLPGVRELFEKEAPRYVGTIFPRAALARCWLKLHGLLLAGSIC